MRKEGSVGLFAFVLLVLSGCSQTPDEQNSEMATAEMTTSVPNEEQVSSSDGDFDDFDFSDERDPFENFNRSMWDLTRDIIDPYIVLPMANAYEKTPRSIRRGLYNFTDNIDEPVSAINNLLQRKPKSAAINFGRFIMNSTFGVFGFFDVASHMGVGREKESFGETLSVYGVPDGPYIMVPGAGPTVVIDRGGDAIEGYLWATNFLSTPATITAFMIRGLEQRIELKQLEPLLENSLDEYAFIREAYFSYWLDKVYDGNPPLENQYDDWDDWDDWGAWEESEPASEPEEN